MVSIRAAKPAARPYKIGCGHGLFLLVNPNGSKLWRFKYRFEGREKALTFGAYPLVSLLDARMQRDAAKLQLLKGIDPAQARKKQEVVRFETVAEQWYRANAAAWAPATAKKVRTYLDKDILPAIGRHAIQSIQRGDLINLLARVESREAFNVASKMRNWLSGIFDEATRQGAIAENPAMGLKLGIAARGRMTQHNATVDLAELSALFAAIDGVNCKPAYKLAIRLIALTACRPGELRLASWDEFDLDKGLWTIPAARMKMRRQHVIPLSRQAIDIASQLKNLAGSGGGACPARQGWG